jgi:hypothetical protein
MMRGRYESFFLEELVFFVFCNCCFGEDLRDRSCDGVHVLCWQFQQ